MHFETADIVTSHFTLHISPHIFPSQSYVRAYFTLEKSHEVSLALHPVLLQMFTEVGTSDLGSDRILFSCLSIALVNPEGERRGGGNGAMSLSPKKGRKSMNLLSIFLRSFYIRISFV